MLCTRFSQFLPNTASYCHIDVLTTFDLRHHIQLDIFVCNIGSGVATMQIQFPLCKFKFPLCKFKIIIISHFFRN